MLYEPIKDRFIRAAAGSQVVRRLYYMMLHVVFLRSWYVRRALQRIIGRMDGAEVRVLDAGTGLGQFAYYMVRRYPAVRVHGVDINESYLEYARRFIGKTRCADRVTYAVEDLTRLQSSGPFDLVLSVDVMEHIEEDVEVFRQFERVLRPGGRVVVNTPSDLGGSGVEHAGDESFIGEHVREGYGREELESKLSAAGLRVEEVTYTYGVAGSLAWRMLIKIPMRLLSMSPLLAILVAPYFLLVLPFGVLLNALDVAADNERGTGILVVARKPAGV